MAKKSSQDFLEFQEIKEGVIVLKNKSLRVVLMVSSLNFALKSEEEQTAIIYQFQNFLNSLDFPCQMQVSSRRLNIIGYIDRLKEFEQKEQNELLKIQIQEYCKFIEEILEGGSIMQKNFYVTVPFSLLESRGPIEGKNKFIKIPSLSQEEFQRCKNQLMQRAEFVALGLKSCGLDVIPLTTIELIELLWGLHHPKEAERGYYPDILPEIMATN